MSFWANVFWANVLWANVHLGKCLSGQMSSGRCLQGKCRSGQMSMGKCLWVNVSGQMSYGQMSGHRIAQGLPKQKVIQTYICQPYPFKHSVAMFSRLELAKNGMLFRWRGPSPKCVYLGVLSLVRICVRLSITAGVVDWRQLSEAYQQQHYCRFSKTGSILLSFLRNPHQNRVLLASLSLSFCLSLSLSHLCSEEGRLSPFPLILLVVDICVGIQCRIC
jgi:hypothetical protein